ncbi:FxsA family protein [Mycoplana ramosa]|uniref:FxsA family protein n=1 Tax=Mycoplana ramosa TaxID=40837 RepID=A0ABW3Z0V4_MYCRA
MARPLIALFLLSLPLLEIAGFIVVGRRIGLGPTLLLVVASAMIGLALLRRQGFQALAKLRQRRLPQDLPAERFFDTAIVLLAGLLLIVPGFVTDVIALLLLVPFIRQHLASRLASRIVVVDLGAAADPHATRQSPPRTIDLDHGDFTRKDRH